MKTPDRHQASSGVFAVQLSLFELPSFSPVYPNPATLVGQALALLLQGRLLTTPDFQAVTQSWRLASYIGKLHDRGWPVAAIEVPFADDPTRKIAAYFMPEWVLREVGGQK